MQKPNQEAQQLVPDHVLIDGQRIAYGIHGQGAPIVLLHGTPSSSFIWRNVVPHLVSAGYQCHLYDLLGYGLSERPWHPDVDTSVTGQVPILLQLLNFWRLEKFHLVAHDIGGGIAQRLAIFHPELIKSLTLIDTVSFDSWPSKRTKQQMRDGLESLIKASGETHRDHFAEWLFSTVQNQQQLRESALDVYLDYISGSIGQGSFFQHQVRLYEPHHTANISDRLSELGQLPVQIIWGEADGWQIVDWAHKLHEAIPNSRLHVVPGCGHFVMEDNPDEVSRLILNFVKGQ